MSSSELEPVGIWGTRRVIVQAMMIAALAALPFWASFDGGAGDRGVSEASSQGAPRLDGARVGATPMGVKPMHTTPISAPTPQESAPEAELPQTGVLQSGTARTVTLGSNPALRLVNPPGSHKLIKLTPVAEPWESVTAFVRSGDSVEIAVRPGRYKVRGAAGWIWFGDAVRFGTETEYFAIDGELEFSIEGRRLLGHEVDLVRVKDGNLVRSDLRPEQF